MEDTKLVVNDSTDFSFSDLPFAQITKSYRDANGQMFIEGIASNIDVDLQGERMAPEAIAKMAARLVGKPLREEHQKGYLNKLGEIVRADVVNDDQNRPALWIKARLYDWSSAAKDTFEAIKSGVKLGLSVAGRIRPGGLVKELAENLGKFVPTYKDVEPTEVSVTDHPANLNTFALAVSKSMQADSVYDPDEFGKDVTNAHANKPKEYADVPNDKFLDADNHKYPADDKHLMPALKYFNHGGQRAAGGYPEDKWASMGRKLAKILNAKTGKDYIYDSSSEKVLQRESETKKEVNTMDNKGNLVSKQYNDDAKSFAKEWGRDLAKEEKVEKAEEKPAAAVEKVEAKEEEVVTKAEDAKEEVKKDAADSSVESLLSSINSTLSDLKSGMAAKKAASTVVEEKAASSSDSDSSLQESITSMARALDTMKEIMAKKKSPVPASSSESESTTSTLGKTLKELVDVVAELKKSQDDVVKSIDDMPRARKGVAVLIEKKFDGHSEVQEFNQDTLDTLTKDGRSTFSDVRKYKNFGEVPAWFGKDNK